MNIDRGVVYCVDTEKIQLSIAAKDQGGVARVIPADQFEWLSGDPEIVMLEPFVDENGIEDGYSRWARTPAPGTTVVTVTNTETADSESVQFVVQVSGPGEIGLSAGAPVPE